jgi:nitrite reductase/ring-hydroxylating ferredoxin subunit
VVNERPPEYACKRDDLAPGEKRLMTIRQRKVLLMRVGDDFYAFQNACPHKAAPLDEGQLHTGRREIICPWHRYRFELETGASVTNQAMVCRHFPVEVRDGAVYVTV